MAKTTVKKDQEMEGGVSRAVDFNLKKEDLMLLILEGRKENMEEQIAKITTASTNLRQEATKVEEKFKEAVIEVCYKLLNKDAAALAKGFSNKENADANINLKEAFKIVLNTHSETVPYTRYSSSPIGDGKGGTYIKTQKEAYVGFSNYNSVKFTLLLSLNGKNYGKTHGILGNNETRACTQHPVEVVILAETLSMDYLRSMKEYADVKKVAEALAENESLLSDILAEYDLFNRNQPRAKAKMIKEVLSSDEKGRGLLDNIIAAASGVKLLA